jgi:type II restriction enzyme
MIKQLRAEAFFEKIYPEVLGKSGNIIFTLNDISVTINTKDSIGHMLQDWVEAWAIQNHIYIRPNPNTQEFPDFYLSDSNEDDLLEIKSFDANASPNFDIANFDTYVRSLLENPKKLDAHYLVFSYSLNSGKITIEGLWLKRIWELSTNSKEWDLKLQVKQGTVYNIRPVNFVSQRANIAQAFKNKLEFVEAIQNVLNQYDKTKGEHENWFETFKAKYQEATGTLLA